jgi:Zn finger protein HypA/HybF involved in hydrogenase expression
MYIIMDNINCVDCCKDSLVEVGGDYCPYCGSKNLQWNTPNEVKLKEI